MTILGKFLINKSKKKTIVLSENKKSITIYTE